jgi:hypothetical protein
LHVSAPVTTLAQLHEAAIEERAGLAADSVPPPYLNAWARLNSHRPFSVSDVEWRLALDDGGRFLDAWGSDAAEAGWTPGEIFDVTVGRVWRLAGQRIEAIGAGYARLSDGRKIFLCTYAWRGQVAMSSEK